jgi:drug/metabolite transporter (DMT)-like permease
VNLTNYLVLSVASPLTYQVRLSTARAACGEIRRKFWLWSCFIHSLLVGHIQILSHVKTIAVLSLGFAIFGYQVTMQGVIGILLALVGVMAYGELKRREAAEAVSQAVTMQLTNEREKSPA